jgi:heme exporter protein A
MQNSLLKVSDLSYSYFDDPTWHLWKPISFSCSSGELLHIKGPNGAGKSTCLRVLTGLLSGFHGKVAWKPEAHRTYLQSDANGLFLDLDYLANLPSNIDKSLVTQWLGPKASMWNGFPVRYFSTGMRRRLGLLRTLSSNAECTLLDEPLLGIDQSGIATLKSSIENNLSQGRSFIVVSHQVDWLESLSPKTILLERP